MSKYGILATLLHYLANTVLLKNLPRWRADNIRPYTVCATELLLKNIGCPQITHHPSMAYPLKPHSCNEIFAPGKYLTTRT